MRNVITVLCLLLALPLGAQQRALSRVEDAPGRAGRYVGIVAKGETLRGSQLSVLALTARGDTVVAWESGRRLIPASNMKLITTGLALHELGPDYRFETRLAYSGRIEDGVLHGDVYIIGGGDPTLGAKDSIAVPPGTLFAGWKKMLTDAGIRRIGGRIVGDGRRFDGPIEQDTWMYQDLGTYYGAGGNGLSFYRNVMDIEVAAGAKPGDPVAMNPVYPATPWMRWSNAAATAAKGTGDKLYLFNTDLAPVAELRGTFAVDRKPKKEECSNKFGALTCAHYFREYLRQNGVAVSGIADITASGRLRSETFEDLGLPADSLCPLGSTLSPSLLRIAKITNWRSDNFYAETLYRILSVEKRGSADYAVCREAEETALRHLGLDPSSVSIVDGSGLSRKNWISPEFFCAFLRRMMDSPVFGDYIGTLASPGKPGPYAGRLQNEARDLKERIFYKSGSMEGVHCYSGYVVPPGGGKEDMVVFSVMLNNCTAPTWKYLPLIDKIIALIATETRDRAEN